MFINKALPACGHISEVYARLQTVPENMKNPKHIFVVYTPFGQLDCTYSGEALGWKVYNSRHVLYMSERKIKSQVFSDMGLVGRKVIDVPWGVLRNPNYKFRKAKRKSKAICPGLDLRPLQQEYRRKLGDLHRFKHALQQIKALYPRVFWDSFDHAPDYFSIKAMEKYLKDNYAYDKQRMIDAYERSKE